MPVQTRSSRLSLLHTSMHHERFEIVISVSWYGNNVLYYNGVLTLLYRVTKQSHRVQWKVIVHHDNSVPKDWIQQCREAGGIMRDQTHLNFKDHHRALWRFLSIPEHKCCMILDIDEDIVHLLSRIYPFWLDRVRKATALNRATLHTQIPNWSINKLPTIIPGGFAIYTHASQEPVFKNISTHIARFLSKTTFQFDNPTIQKADTREAYGKSYGTDEFFLNQVLLPQLETIQIYRCPMLLIRANDYSTKNIEWKFLELPRASANVCVFTTTRVHHKTTIPKPCNSCSSRIEWHIARRRIRNILSHLGPSWIRQVVWGIIFSIMIWIGTGW